VHFVDSACEEVKSKSDGEGERDLLEVGSFVLFPFFTSIQYNLIKKTKSIFINVKR